MRILHQIVCLNMKLTQKQLDRVIEETKDDKKRRLLLRVIFEDPANIELFGYFFFKEYITHPFADFHKEIIEIMLRPHHDAIGAPRGHGKSTLVGLVYLIWLIVNKKEKYIVYVSANYRKTVQFLTPIRDQLKNNKLLKAVYDIGNIKAEKDDDGKDREDCYDVLGVRIEAASFETNVRGFKHKESRPTLIICDDIETDERVINPDLRLKDSDKLNKVIIPSLSPNGRIKFIGTILHWDSLLVKKIRLYNGKIFRAIKDSVILWPQLFSKEKLEEIKQSIGSVAFSSEYLNNPIENEASLIKGEWIRRCFDETKTYEGNRTVNYDSTYLGCDFAFGDRVTNDKSAFVHIGVHNGVYDICSINTYKGLSVTEQFEIIQDLHNKNNYNEIVMEENSIKSMSKNLYEYDFPYYLIWTGATDTAAKLRADADFQDKRHTVGKKAMILRLATQFENSTISIPYKTDKDKEISNQLYEELTTFALNDGKLVEVGIHADIPIALAMALERASEPGSIVDFG